MITYQQAIEMINERGYVQNIGQIDDKTRRALDRDVKNGLLVKSREPWAMIVAVNKTTWRVAS
jgi:hypothetical protein